MSTIVLDPKDKNLDKKADLAGPGIGDYKELETILPRGYHSLLTPKETQQALYQVKRYIADNLCQELNLMMVEVPLIVDVESGVNDMLDRDGSRTPIQFHISCKPRPSGNVSLSSNSIAKLVRASAPTCAPCARTISSITTILPTSISGIGSAPSPPSSATLTFSRPLSARYGR
jgi:hypothetical protein